MILLTFDLPNWDFNFIITNYLLWQFISFIYFLVSNSIALVLESIHTHHMFLIWVDTILQTVFFLLYSWHYHILRYLYVPGLYFLNLDDMFLFILILCAQNCSISSCLVSHFSCFILISSNYDYWLCKMCLSWNSPIALIGFSLILKIEIWITLLIKKDHALVNK